MYFGITAQLVLAYKDMQLLVFYCLRILLLLGYIFIRNYDK